jgi:hypothetical protein
MNEIRSISFADRPEPVRLDASEALRSEEITWARILEEEPAVAKVFAELRAVPKGNYRRWRHYVKVRGTSPKADLAKLVGWHARNPRLRSQKAYEMAIERMWDLVL